MERKPRGIRLNDSEWGSFKSLLGAVWLRKQIDKAEKKAKAPAVHTKPTKE